MQKNEAMIYILCGYHRMLEFPGTIMLTALQIQYVTSKVGIPLARISHIIKTSFKETTEFTNSQRLKATVLITMTGLCKMYSTMVYIKQEQDRLIL